MTRGLNPKVDEYLRKVSKWQAEMEKLRGITLDCRLSEDFKWGKPCYTFQNNNVVLIHAFKGYCAILFFKGALLKDSHGIMVSQTENVQAGRQIRFTNLKEIEELETIIKAYIDEAIEVEKAGLKVDFKKAAEFAIPEEFGKRLNEEPALKAAFEDLTPGRQRAYLLYFSEPKQAKTREARIQKNMQQILNGKGLND